MAEISEDTRADIALIERAVAQDQTAIAELYDKHSRLLFGLILRVLKERSEAEDVLQEVFLSVWSRAHTYKPALGSPAAWLVGIARNRAIDRLRANGVRLHAVEVSHTPPPAATMANCGATRDAASCSSSRRKTTCLQNSRSAGKP